MPNCADSVNYEEALFVRNFGKASLYCSPREDLSSASSNEIDDGIAQCNMSQISVYHWPSLEKIVTFGESHLDSKSAFVIFSPSTELAELAGNVLYFWVGGLSTVMHLRFG